MTLGHCSFSSFPALQKHIPHLSTLDAPGLSVYGPLLIFIYTHFPGVPMQTHGFKYHLLVDDSKIFISSPDFFAEPRIPLIQ